MSFRTGAAKLERHKDVCRVTQQRPDRANAGDALPFILKQGFRPFFFGGAFWAVVAIVLWLAMLTGSVALPIAIDPLAWHQHEMLFGFASAIIAGFLLTAIPNWTGRLPVAGIPLAGLAGLWLTGRLAQAFSGVIGVVPAAVVDASFLILLTALTGYEIVIGKNGRNVLVVVLIGLLAGANVLFHLEQVSSMVPDGTGARQAMAVIGMLIALIGGRVLPSFTRNWLAKQKAEVLPAAFDRYDRAVLIVLALALLGFVTAPDAVFTGLLLAVAGLLHLVRLSRWCGWSTRREPLVWSLHAGYLWFAVGVTMLGLAVLVPGMDRPSAVHALTAGGFGTMMLAVMTRASLGHSGRPLAADRLTTTIYAAVILGALGRVASALMSGQAWLIGMGLLWASAFLLFVVGYGPLLWGVHRWSPSWRRQLPSDRR
jgi:uncharacterized protein involved in response to NO